MLFEVSRTSLRLGDEKTSPCDGCFEDKVVYVDHRQKIIDKDEWFSKGSNHRQNPDGTFDRDMREYTSFFIEINTLEDLWDFQEKYGELIIGKSIMDRKTPYIEIYDDYRE